MKKQIKIFTYEYFYSDIKHISTMNMFILESTYDGETRIYSAIFHVLYGLQLSITVVDTTHSVVLISC